MPAKRSHRDIRIQRAYDAVSEDGSYRILVDRFWPRGVSKADLHPDAWARELAPTPDLIKWFGHQAERWQEFRDRYLRELSASATQEGMKNLLAAAGKRDITLLYGARDEQHNQAVVLREALLAMDQHGAHTPRHPAN
jgi:uncharacterized protein YeaO (DUF488 family)